MIPDTCVPTSTSVTGSIVPVAVIELLIVPLCTAEVAKLISWFDFFPPNIHSPAPASTIIAAALMKTFFLFISSYFTVCSL